MYRFVIPTILALAATSSSIELRSFPPLRQDTAASEAQIRFAIENKYDDTGPGAKEPEYAYNTYKTLDEAIVGYLDDPDTKLPEHERANAIQKLLNPTTLNPEPLQRYLPKTVAEYTGYKPPVEVVTSPKYNFPERNIIHQQYKYYNGDLYSQNNDIYKGVQKKRLEPFKLQRIQPVKGSPLNLAHYSRDPDLQAAHDQFDPHAKYTFTYGVHDKDTGDLKTAQETREGGTVHGFYSFMDADGKLRTVQYTADDAQGFRATVDKTHA